MAGNANVVIFLQHILTSIAVHMHCLILGDMRHKRSHFQTDGRDNKETVSMYLLVISTMLTDSLLTSRYNMIQLVIFIQNYLLSDLCSNSANLFIENLYSTRINSLQYIERKLFLLYVYFRLGRPNIHMTSLAVTSLNLPFLRTATWYFARFTLVVSIMES